MHVEPAPKHQVEHCLQCGGGTRQETIELRYEFDGICIVVKGVPATVCQQCGEQYISGQIGVWLGTEVTRLAGKLRTLIDDEDALEGLKVQADLSEGLLQSSDGPLMWAPA